MERVHSSLGQLSPMGFKCQKPNPQSPLQQDTPILCMPCKKTPWQPTPGLSGTQWLEDLFREPPQSNEPPNPGPSPSSKQQEDVSACEPEPEVALMQSLEEPFVYSSRYPLIGNNHQQYARWLPPPPSLEITPINPTMRLGRNLLTCSLPSLFLEQLSTNQSAESCWSIADGST
ncbi:hypothetical protein O181_065678 [Austropuccinia psidii MF-1]|uniref:Uncharacterized protein n=1 Tax=Austropuccinia psidii MF-1 TaxID=1389203 RepID=A0A9Q3EQ25_9BASI|nr:hypothetical protein [Austropuccinia psidii MF-1]